MLLSSHDPAKDRSLARQVPVGVRMTNRKPLAHALALFFSTQTHASKQRTQAHSLANAVSPTNAAEFTIELCARHQTTPLTRCCR